MRDAKTGRFLKGIVPWNKDKIGVYSNETLDKMRKMKLGKHISPATEFKKEHIPWIKGKRGVTYANRTSFKHGRQLPPEIEYKRLENLRQKILIKPNLDPTENLGYVLGMLMGDGCVYPFNRSYRIVLDITNKTIASEFSESLRNIGLHPWIKERMPTNGVGKLKKYIVIANSKMFGEWYKSLTIKSLSKISTEKEFIKGFLRGFYEAEGYVHRDKRTGTPYVHIGITDLNLIKFVKSMAEVIGVKFNLYGPYDNRRGLSKERAKPIYRITASSTNAYKFIETVQSKVKTL